MYFYFACAYPRCVWQCDEYSANSSDGEVFRDPLVGLADSLGHAKIMARASQRLESIHASLSDRRHTGTEGSLAIPIGRASPPTPAVASTTPYWSRIGRARARRHSSARPSSRGRCPPEGTNERITHTGLLSAAGSRPRRGFFLAPRAVFAFFTNLILQALHFAPPDYQYLWKAAGGLVPPDIIPWNGWLSISLMVVFLRSGEALSGPPLNP